MYTIGNYRIYKKSIGKGSFSKIYKGIDKDNNDIAVKIIKKKSIDEKLILREISLLKKVNHINIVKLIDVYVSKNKYYIILEYCHYGDLKKFTKREFLVEGEVLNFMTQIKNGLEYLYNNNIIHRDLKPQNILVTYEKILKISDFGFAKYHTENLSQTICGSPLYMAPEILTYKKYTDSADLWSVGVIMYELFFNKTPVNGKNIYNLVKNIKKYKFDVDNNDKISDLALKLLYGLLKKDPNERISWKQFFVHPWFSSKVKVKVKDYDNDLMFSMDVEGDNSKIYDSKDDDDDDDDDSKNDSKNVNSDKNYSVLYSYNNINVDDGYLNIESSSLIESLDDNYVVISSSPAKYTQTIPKSFPKTNYKGFKNIIDSLRSSISFIFSPRSF